MLSNSFKLLLWVYVKSEVYVNKSPTIAEFKMQIRRVIGEINGDVCGRVIVNFNERITASRNFGVGHMLDVIFHHKMGDSRECK